MGLYRLVYSQADKVNQASIADVVRRIKFIMFPNNGYPATRPPDPTSEGQILIRESLERRLIELAERKINHETGESRTKVELSLAFFASLFVGQSSPVRECTIHNFVEPFSNNAANAHLLLFLLDAALLALFPEAGLPSNGLIINM
jgi:hypothetical protein